MKLLVGFDATAPVCEVRVKVYETVKFKKTSNSTNYMM